MHRGICRPAMVVGLLLALTGCGGGNQAASTTQGTRSTSKAASLVSIVVTPANPSVTNLTEQFTATGTYSDNSTQDLTSKATWISSNTTVASISNASGTDGLATMVNLGSSTISATLGSISGTTELSVSAAPMQLGRSPVTWAEAHSFNTPSYNGHELLAANSPWFAAFRQDISELPADPNSNAMLARMVNAGGTVNATGISGSYTPSTWNWYTMPINIVAGTVQPLSIPGTWKYDPASNGPYLLPAAPVSFESDTNTNYVTAWTDTADHHLLVLQRDPSTGGPDKLWEYYQPTVTLDSAGNISAISGASYRVFDLENGEDPATDTPSTDAAGLPIMPLLLNYNEVASGSINHVLRGELNNSDIRPYYIWPARTNAGAWNPQGIPYGAILRLKQSWWDANATQVLGVGTQASVIGEAMRKYGIMIADGTVGSSIELAGIADWRWSSDLLKRLDSIPVSAFEVVELQPTVTITGPGTLAVGEKGTWTLSLTNPGEPGPVNLNVWDYTNPSAPALQAWRFAELQSPNQRSVTVSDTFTAPGTYRIMPYQRVYMNYNNTGFIITVQ